LAAIPPIASVLLPTIIGRQRAFDAVVSMRKIDAKTALAWGLVAQVVEPSELARAALDYSERILSLSQIAVRACKRALALTDISRAMELYRDVVLTSSDGVEGIAAFLEKRSPVWAHITTVGG
ncbi:MAG: enoyl-CoA hydratase/isomerase family protein, partial [Vulcanimicrobiaceae bacterium]